MAGTNGTARLTTRCGSGIGLAVLLVAALAAPARAGGPTALVVEPRNDVTPAMGRHYLAWARATGRFSDSPYRVRVLDRETKTLTILNDRGSAFGGGFDGNAFVYQLAERGNSDLRWINMKTGVRHGFPTSVNSRAWDFHPTVSGNWILFGRNAVNQGYGYSILLFNTDTLELRKLATRSDRFGALYPGQVNGRYAVWTRTGRQSWDVFLYDIAAGTTTRLPRGGFFAQYAPSVTSSGAVYFARSGNGCGVGVGLAKRPIGGPTTELLTFPKGEDVPETYVFEDSSHVVHFVYAPDATCEGAGDIYELTDDGGEAAASAGRPAPRPMARAAPKAFDLPYLP